jgi:hypothetical protein
MKAAMGVIDSRETGGSGGWFAERGVTGMVVGGKAKEGGRRSGAA